jgi:hypothetical protein
MMKTYQIRIAVETRPLTSDKHRKNDTWRIQTMTFEIEAATENKAVEILNQRINDCQAWIKLTIDHVK